MIILSFASLLASANHRIFHPLLTVIGSVETYILDDHRCLWNANICENQVFRYDRLPHQRNVRIEVLFIEGDFCFGQRLPNLAGQAIQRFRGLHTGPQHFGCREDARTG